MNLPNPNNNNSTVRHTELSALVDILRNIKRLENNLSNMSSPTSLISVLQSIESVLINANWSSIPGNSITYSYYAGIDPVNNPSGNINNLETISYISGGGTVFTQTISYDLNNNVTAIVTV